MKGYLPLIVLLVALAVLLCRLAPPVHAVELSEPIPGAALAYDFGDWSGDSSSPDHDPEAPPREEEALSEEQEPAEGGQDVEESDYRTMGEEATAQEDEPAEGGQDVEETDYRTMGEEAVWVEPEPAEGGQDVEEEDFSLMGEEATAQEDEPAEGGQDVEETTSTDLSPVTERLDSINFLLVFLLGSIWAIAGMFFAFKLGGALL